MNKLAVDLLRKNHRIEIVFLGSKSPKPLLAKFKLLCGIDVKTVGFLESNSLTQLLYDYHYLVPLDNIWYVLDALEGNYVLFNSDFPRCTSFCYDLTGLYGNSKYTFLERIFKVLHHPTLFIDTDDEKVILRSIGVFYNLNVEEVSKAFSIANQVYSLKEDDVNFYKF